MKGLELSKQYFECYGIPMLKSLTLKYPELEGQFAAGLIGQGSECLGFDDDLSTDHDFGPSFCIWLKRDLYQKYAAVCQDAYEQLPTSFLEFPARKVMPQGGNRVGVLCAEDFYFGFLGMENPPSSDMEWFQIPEENLASASNGALYLDENGYFSAVRKILQNGYPEDVRRKKIAAKAALMAQSGQYNYSRCCRRGEWTGASLALSEFVKSTCQIVHLLNRRYTPFYKWMHRSIRDVSILPEIYGLLDQLTEGSDNRSAWKEACEDDFLFGIINTRDKNAVLIETICQLVIRELNAQKLSDIQDMYLEPHAISVMEKIETPNIRMLPLLYG